MLEAVESTIYMHEGDYGVALAFRVTGGDALPEDHLRFSVSAGGIELLHKDYGAGDLQDGAFLLSLTEAETALLPRGTYLWRLVLLRDGAERNTVKGPCMLTVLGD